MKLNCGAERPHYSMFNVDMAAKRRKKHKNKISGLVNSMCYNEQKSKFRLFTNPSSIDQATFLRNVSDSLPDKTFWLNCCQQPVKKNLRFVHLTQMDFHTVSSKADLKQYPKAHVN
jgi:hypothetical protein